LSHVGKKHRELGEKTVCTGLFVRFVEMQEGKLQ